MIKNLTPNGWTWYQLIVAGILLTVGARLVDPVVSFGMQILRQASG